MNKKSLRGNLYPQKLQTNHLFRIMRISLLLIFVFIFSLNAKEGYSQNARITLSRNNSTIEAILNEIESQTDYLFIVNSNIDINKKVSVKVKETSVSKVLNDLFKGTNVHYSMEGTHIVLSDRVIEQLSPSDNKEVIITGTVIDNSGEPLPGVNILLKGTTIGVITDFDGKYSIRIPEAKGELTFSYIGYSSIVLPVGNKTVINVTMKEDTEILGEVVVTAMGIERKAASLTYATQSIGGSELTRAKDANFINALQGKSAGLVITPNASGAGGSSKLLLRGNSSILGNNQPLIVLDGVPMADRNSTQIEDALLSGGNTTDGGDGLSNINPDDIASMTILKGANAAALYGSKAANGVIIITTKQGTEGRVSIDVSSSSLFETPLVTPQFQNDYGSNASFYYDNSLNPNEEVYKRRLELQSWGPRMGSYSQATLNEIPYARNSGMDNVSSFLQTGTNFNNSISISSGTKVSSTYFSYGNTTAQGIVPNNKFYRHNVSFRQSIKFFDDHLQLDLSGSYIKQKSKNRPGSGFYGNSLYSLYLMPRNADIGYFKNNSEVQGEMYYINKYNNEQTYRTTGVVGPIQQWPWISSDDQNSPYWYMNRLNREQERERMFATIGMKVNIIKGLTAEARFKVDYTRDTNENKTWKGTKHNVLYNSIYEYSKNSSDQLFADFLISYNKKFGNFDVSANLGGSTQKDDYSSFGINYWMNDSTAIPNVFDPENIVTKDGASTNTTKTKDQNWENAIYATASIGYKDMAYIDGSVRTDWARPFTQFEIFGIPDHFTYFSVGGNVMLDRAFAFENKYAENLKLRLSYSEVGNSIPNLNYGAMGLNFGSMGAVASAYRSFYNPVPEKMRSTEIGLDGNLFNRTVTFDITFYNTMMVNQWLPKSSSTGGMLPLNSGKIRNRGLETTVSYILSPNADFNWKTTVNYSYNTNKILETYGENLDSPMTTEPVFQGGLRVKYEVGKPYGELYGKTFMRDENGKILTDRKGAPRITTTYDEYLGNANSPHHLGWGNAFNYKDFSLYFLVDGKIGGTVISYTEARLDYNGVSKRSGDARNSGITYLQKGVIGGVPVGETVPGIVMPDGNIAPVQEYYQAIGGGEPCLSEYAYSATNFRLREVSLGYTFRNVFGNGRNLGVSLVGRNLFFLYKDSPVDPDVSVSTANSYGGIEAFSLPSTRSFGINLKASF